LGAKGGCYGACGDACGVQERTKECIYAAHACLGCFCSNGGLPPEVPTVRPYGERGSIGREACCMRRCLLCARVHAAWARVCSCGHSELDCLGITEMTYCTFLGVLRQGFSLDHLATSPSHVSFIWPSLVRPTICRALLPHPYLPPAASY
jgi:hypothetical protein